MMAEKGADSRSFLHGVWVLPTSKNAKMPPAANRAFFGKVYAFPLLAKASPALTRAPKHLAFNGMPPYICIDNS
ncbi:MAG: hypothetical protein VB012_04810 [Erysipelotrichaceae bacterium]|nr:hypothetical protein [Erysipelotrichaceae bacterium]